MIIIEGSEELNAPVCEGVAYRDLKGGLKKTIDNLLHVITPSDHLEMDGKKVGFKKTSKGVSLNLGREGHIDVDARSKEITHVFRTDKDMLNTLRTVKIDVDGSMQYIMNM